MSLGGGAATTATPRAGGVPSLLLLAGLSAAMLVRVGVAPRDTARSPLAGAVFAALLLALAAAAGVRPSRPAIGALLAGAMGAGVLVAGPLLGVAGGARWLARPGTDGLVAWAVVVIAVAVTEEWLLRGALYGAVERLAGSGPAVVVAAIAFALLHVPLYGWGVVPLDLAVGVWLGGLRRATGGVAAPATAHALADVCGWWLR